MFKVGNRLAVLMAMATMPHRTSGLNFHTHHHEDENRPWIEEQYRRMWNLELVERAKKIRTVIRDLKRI